MDVESEQGDRNIVEPVSIRDVAREAGVSITTVSRALSGTGRVSAATAAKVRHIADQLGYQPNAFGSGLSSGRSGACCIVAGEMSNPFFPELLHSLERSLVERGYRLLVLSATNDRAQLKSDLVHLLAGRVDGFLVVGADAATEQAVLELLNRVPVVQVDRATQSPGVLVASDHEHGAYLATRHLLALGHDRIAHFRGPAGLRTADLRELGYRRAITDSGTDGEPIIIEAGFDEVAGREAGTVLLGSRLGCTAVFAANDLVAIGAIDLFHDAGLSVPSDISVIGFDDIRIARYLRPRLSTIQQDTAEIGRSAAHLIADLIECGTAPETTMTIPVALVTRESTSPPARTDERGAR